MVREPIDAAERYGHVVSMGHGILNKFISLELTRLGWIKIESSGSGYASYVTHSSPKGTL